jgi:hypothetical protein
LGFFRLGGPHTLGLVTLQTGVFVQGGIHQITYLGLIGGFLVMRFASDRRAEIHDFAARRVD